MMPAKFNGSERRSPRLMLPHEATARPTADDRQEYSAGRDTDEKTPPDQPNTNRRQRRVRFADDKQDAAETRPSAVTKPEPLTADDAGLNGRTLRSCMTHHTGEARQPATPASSYQITDDKASDHSGSDNSSSGTTPPDHSTPPHREDGHGVIAPDHSTAARPARSTTRSSRSPDR